MCARSLALAAILFALRCSETDSNACACASDAGGVRGRCRVVLRLDITRRSHRFLKKYRGSKSLVTAVALTPVGSPPVRTAFQSRTVRLRQACAAFTTTRVSCLGYTTTRAMSPGDEPGVGLCVRRCAGSEGWTRMTPPSRCFASAANSSMDIRPSGRSSYQLRGEGSGGKEL